ncbi:uncharacterized protein LOC129794028 [Lutzomyia longipalpis]|uniref:uncharacterized protein LOC129794028 n=1 Tax=Lutzomyia longipalpis TaxID=7200 RepID=UPI0024840B1D|nr:uncharacterized protein LOC129794028 [Lutzomyia longipalpis]
MPSEMPRNNRNYSGEASQRNQNGQNQDPQAPRNNDERYLERNGRLLMMMDYFQVLLDNMAENLRQNARTLHLLHQNMTYMREEQIRLMENREDPQVFDSDDEFEH